MFAHGGIAMDNRYEPDVALLVQYGHIIEGTVELVPGKSRQCHYNTAQLWNQHKDTLAIVTGYVLFSEENRQWIQHSWLIRKHPTAEQPRIIETTLACIKYFGVILNEEQAHVFAKRELHL
ncbi:hypothetical protein KDH_66160 [Dictyobacter sp. S3.2.2.5]|uniref:Uncharacterized protein n=1 Tax=Dictyobacter halimunensis TaxID=3026934 RepID=A0ABQ6G115_9CHLR|nr:hypothetical protein KDH_66160 [Dictyobacter sp. S3.2.2.5]